jgi:hypothetical protein
MLKPITAYPALALIAISAFSLGGALSSQRIINDTLKLCNQKPLECKFKYDILMYNETGRVPYKEEKPKPAAVKK